MALRTASGSRRMALQGCFNFRDVGGYRAADGQCTRWRRLFRSDGLHRLTPADQREVASLNIAAVLDLRTSEEVADQGWARVKTSQHHLPMIDVLPAVSGFPECQVEPAVVADRYYTTLVASFETVREVLAVLTDPSSYPAVVCCPTGIDRTGIVMAVLLGLLDVPDTTVIRDYAASREATLRRVGRLRFEHPTAVRGDVDRYGAGLLGVLPEAMAQFLDRVREEHGSFLGYAESIDMAGAVPYLRAALLERRD